MLCYAIYPTLLPQLQREWGASNSAAGLISGMFFAGYMAAVPVLTGLTDRVDARRVYLFSSLLCACGCLGFALFAQGVWSAALFQGLTGAGIAGTYMPGLRALTDNLDERAQSRAVSFYTAVFGFGASLSILLAGAIAATLGWRWAFGLCALGPLVAGSMIVGGLPPRRAARRGAQGAARLAAGARQSCRARLHPRLHRALLGAVRLALVDGGVLCVLPEPVGRRRLAMEPGAGRGDRQSVRAGGQRARQRARDALRAQSRRACGDDLLRPVYLPVRHALGHALVPRSSARPSSCSACTWAIPPH